ncbi:hypothetical protein Y032_0006g3130 [Ancylostoma ceylanicum]|uniref:Uncharacterized protein n=1 Tax=Ancylostoma ceylanicum TaxID=53326 RepID=A0A016VQV1_9BILA|nr:hypothetical protein Y032_0006g3130 [Ancylostoma ceylanicum]
MATGLPSHKRIKNWMKPVFTVDESGTLCGSSTLKEPRGSQFWFNLMLKSEPGRRKSKKTPEFRKFRKSEFCPFLHWTH